MAVEEEDARLELECRDESGKWLLVKRRAGWTFASDILPAIMR